MAYGAAKQLGLNSLKFKPQFLDRLSTKKTLTK